MSDGDDWGVLKSLTPNQNSIPLVGDKYSFGRSSECPPQFRFSDRKVSSKHFTIAKNEDKIFLEDLRYT